MDQQKIGQFIAERRRERGLTQAQLAEALGVTDKSVSKWERGVCLPDASNYQPLCEALGMTISEFFAGERIASPADPAIAEAAAVSLAETSDARRRKYRRIIAALIAAGILLLAGLIFAMRQTVRDPFAFKDHIEQSETFNTQLPLFRMLAGRKTPFLYDFSFKQDLEWLSFTLREYHDGELVNETAVGGVEIGWGRDPKTKKPVTGSVALLLDMQAGQLTVSVCNASGGVSSWDAAFEPLPSDQPIDYYPQLGGSVIEEAREIQLVGFAYDTDSSGLSAVPADSAAVRYDMQAMDYCFTFSCCFESGSD